MTLKPGACLTLCFFLYWGQSYCVAQDKSNPGFGKVTGADFNLPSSSIIDSNINAVILSDIGSVHFSSNRHGRLSYVYKRQTRIKILNKAAFEDLATVSLFLYTQENDPETVENLSASTYNLEDGKVAETKLEKTELFETRIDKNRIEKKFTLPGVKEGSILEYTYTIMSDYYFDLPSWQFQRQKYPCLWSEYQVNIPDILSYILVKQGIHAYVVDKGSVGHESYRVTQSMNANTASLGNETEDLTISSNTVVHRWAMKDIPAFRDERYLSTPLNYLDKIDFQLARSYNGEEYSEHKNSWKQATEELLEQENFGSTLDGDNYLIAAAVTKLSTGQPGALDRARAIYYYVTGHFTCDDHNDMYLRTTLHDIMKKGSGSVGDINLLLIAMLRKAGLEADPVILSTREHGFNLASYPILEKLNYVIARVVIYGKVYYLDAARPQLGFGQLDGNCYNGHARIISNKDSGSVYFFTDSLKEKKTTVVFITGTDKGMEGSWQSTLGSQESYALRERVTEKGEKDYFKDIQTQSGEDLAISNGGIDALDRPEDLVKVHYEFRINQTQGASPLYINPFIGEGTHTNPFTAAERKYPVEMPYARDELYVFSMQVPDGYAVEELPKSSRAVLNGDQGFFEYLIGEQGGMIQLRCHLKLNKANFPPEDYNSLRDFYTLIVKKEGESIVLKKQ